MWINKFCLFVFLVLLIVPVAAQDDEARAASGLPQMIGRRPCSNPGIGADASLSGSINVIGMPEGAKSPGLTVTLLANGTVVQRQRVKSRDAFHFACIPRYGVSLIVEADGLEIGNYPLGTLNAPPLSNRQEVNLTWSQLGVTVNRQNAVISLRNTYERTDDNQKAFDKAMAGLKSEKASNSIKLFKQITETDANDFVAWTELGTLYFNDEKPAEAEAAYSKAISLKADFQPALLNLGKVLISQKKADQAVEVLTRLIAVEPDSADANHYLGEAYLLARRGSSALTYLEKALTLEPIEKAEIHLRLAALFNGAGLKDRAVAEYKRFLEKVPNHPEKAKIEKYISDNKPKS
jgi:tetratricopeptide (TPR) repeat protein